MGFRVQALGFRDGCAKIDGYLRMFVKPVHTYVTYVHGLFFNLVTCRDSM